MKMRMMRGGGGGFGWGCQVGRRRIRMMMEERDLD